MSFKSRLSLYIILFTTILIVIQQWIHAIPEDIQWFFFGSVLLLFGIPHGALDHLIDQKIQESGKTKFSHWRFHLKYMATIAAYILLWNFFPVTSFVLFLLISAFHFGETDLAIAGKSFSTIFLHALYGTLLLLIFLFVYRDNARFFEKEIASFSRLIETGFSWMQNPYFEWVWMGLFFVFIFVYMVSMPGQWQSLFMIAGRLLFVYISSVYLPFPVSFAIYFGLWHSLLSLSNIKIFMSDGERVEISWLQLLRKAAPLALVSIAGLIVLAFIFVQFYHTKFYMLSLFVGVSVLTLPHQHIMSNMNKLIRKQ